MPLLDLVITVKGLDYKSERFPESLHSLAWVDEYHHAMQFFSGMCNNRIYCPSISRGNYNCLRMSWREGPYELIIWLYPGNQTIKFALGTVGSEVEISDVPVSEALTLVESWASYLLQDEEEKNEPTKPKKGVRP